MGIGDKDEGEKKKGKGICPILNFLRNFQERQLPRVSKREPPF
jgi:hypothetical protein